MNNDITRYILDVAIDEGKWTELLDRIAHQVGSRSATILSFDQFSHEQGHGIAEFSSVLDAASVKYYQENFALYEKGVYEDVTASVPGELIIENDFLENPDALRSRPDVAYLLEEWNLFYRAAMRLNEDRGRLEAISCQFADGEPPDYKFVQQYFNHVQPQLSQALLLSRTFYQLRRKYQLVFSVLDRVGVALFVLVGEAGQVLISNKLADELLAKSDVFTLDSAGCLREPSSRNPQRLAPYVSEMMNYSEQAPRISKRVFSVPGESELSPYVVEVSPLTDPDDEMNCNYKGVLVTVFDPDLSSRCDLTGFDSAYSLSPSEAAVAELVTEGYSTKEIADIRGVGLETVKSQISVLLRKTDSNNRTELVRKALIMNPPIKHDSNQ